MAKKTVEIKTDPRGQKENKPSAEAWVNGTGQGSAESTYRFTIDVPRGLHKRIKRACVEKDMPMAEAIRAILEREFPAEA